MDVTIHTSDPETVLPAEVAAALVAANYFVASVTVIDRTPGGAGTRVWDVDVEGIHALDGEQ